MEEWGNAMREDMNLPGTEEDTRAVETPPVGPIGETSTADPAGANRALGATVLNENNVSTPDSAPAKKSKRPRSAWERAVATVAGLAVLGGIGWFFSSRNNSGSSDLETKAAAGQSAPAIPGKGPEATTPVVSGQSMHAPNGKLWSEVRKYPMTHFAIEDLVDSTGTIVNTGDATKVLQTLLDNRAVAVVTGELDDARTVYGKGTVSDGTGPFGDVKTEVDLVTGQEHLTDQIAAANNRELSMPQYAIARIRSTRIIPIIGPGGRPVVEVVADVATTPAGSGTPEFTVQQFFLEWKIVHLDKTNTTVHRAWLIIDVQELFNAPPMNASGDNSPTSLPRPTSSSPFTPNK